MSIKNYLEVTYKYENPGQGVNDDFSSQFDLTKQFTIDQLIIFLKLFFYKIPFLDKKIIDTVIPHKIRMNPSNGNTEDEFEERLTEEELENVEKLTDYFTSIDENIDKIAEDKENIEYFKEQIQENPELLKEAFKSFLKDTMSE